METQNNAQLLIAVMRLQSENELLQKALNSTMTEIANLQESAENLPQGGVYMKNCLDMINTNLKVSTINVRRTAIYG